MDPETGNGTSFRPWRFDHEEGLFEPSTPPTILIVDWLERNRQFLRGMLKSEHYRIREAAYAMEALSVLGKEHVDLVVLDLMLPDISALEFCRQLKSERKTRLIPVLILTAEQGVENEIAGMRSGADEFLVRPLHPALVRARVASMLRHKAAIDSREEAETILFTLAQAVEQRDKTTGSHCERLASLAVTLGTALALPKADLQALYRGGYLHDIGKISVPDAVLFKPGPLTKEEWEIMRHHAAKGEEICRAIRSMAPVLPIIRSHHERWDGSGYPDGLCGEEIPLLARILQTADIYDALTSPRPYKRAYSKVEALEILEEEARRNWRDPELITLFREVCLDRSGEFQAGAGPVQLSLENMVEAIDSFRPAVAPEKGTEPAPLPTVARRR